MALWAARSFYHFARVDWPITFHDGGGLDERIRGVLLSHFPNARVVGWDEATQLVEPRLLEAGFLNVARARRANVLVRKLVDCAILNSARNMLCMDSDVLLLSKPEELIELGAGSPEKLWFNRDYQDSYAISPQQASEWFGVSLPAKVNSGLGLIPVRFVDLEFVDRAYAVGRIPIHDSGFAEQTVFALLAARLGGPAFLPDAKYTVAKTRSPLDLAGIGLVSRHYVSPARHLFYEEGLPFLIRDTTILGTE